MHRAVQPPDTEVSRRHDEDRREGAHASTSGRDDDGDASWPHTPASEAETVAEATGSTPIVPPAAPPARRWASLVGIVAGAVVLTGLSAAFTFFPIDWQAIGSWGYLGVFGVVLIATSSIALPIPYLLIVARAGSFLDPVGIALVAGLAGVLGELAGYLIGVGGSGLIPHGRWYRRAHDWVCTYGFWCIALFACIPNPFFDAIGLVSGTLRYSWWRFALACFLGKSVKFLVAALVGLEVAQHGWLR